MNELKKSGHFMISAKQILFGAVLLFSSLYIQGMEERLDKVKQIKIQEDENGVELTALFDQQNPEKIIKIHKNRSMPTHAEIFVKHADYEVSIDLEPEESERLFNLLMLRHKVRSAYPIKKWQPITIEDIEIYLNSQPSSIPSDNKKLLLLKKNAKQLALGTELDKLASNISFGRSWAGIHYRFDNLAGLTMNRPIENAVSEPCSLDFSRNASIRAQALYNCYRDWYSLRRAPTEKGIEHKMSRGFYSKES